MRNSSSATAQPLVVGLKVSFFAALDVPLDLEHERHDFVPRSDGQRLLRASIRWRPAAELAFTAIPIDAC